MEIRLNRWGKQRISVAAGSIAPDLHMKGQFLDSITLSTEYELFLNYSS